MLVSVEVKYTDTFSAKPLVTWDRYAEQLTSIGVDEEIMRRLVAGGCSQVLRQVMLTASVGRTGMVPGVSPSGRVDEVMAVVFARADDETAGEVAKTLNRSVSVPVVRWTIGDFLEAAAAQPSLTEWAGSMTDRYLGAD